MHSRMGKSLLGAVLLMVATQSFAADPVHYELTFERPNTHLMDITIRAADLSLIEGQIAGLAAAGRRAEPRGLFGARRRAQRFARALDRTCRLRRELRGLPSPETMICRCEDVPYSRLQEHTSWRAAKLHTRCGMGPCQGRICGPATQFLIKWNPDSVRPPVFPARVENLAVMAGRPEPEHIAVAGGLL